MGEAVAQEKYHCPSCGADAHWNPERQALVCPYCGTVAPGQLNTATGEVKENDLVSALRNLGREKLGWKAEKKSVKCQSCQAISVFDPERVAQGCEFCGSAQIVPYEQIKPPIQPESLLPFRVSDSQARDRARQWYRSRWFAPNRLRDRAMTDTIQGVYLPYWTFDARVHADWTAESGYHYYTTETYRDAQGNTQTRQVQHTRWVPSSGSLDHFFDDELISGSRGINPGLLQKIEPYPTKELIPYDPACLAGWIVEQYQIDLLAAAGESRKRMESEMVGLCSRQVPGDTYRGLSVDCSYSGQTFKHTLLPVWLLTYNYGSKVYQVLINGYTGQIAGKHPLSAWKIFFLVSGILLAILIIALVAQGR